jgi:hypothetical protein
MKNRFRNFTFLDLDLALLCLQACFAITFLIDSRTYNPTAALFPRLVAVVALCLLFGAMCQHLFNRYNQTADIPEAEDVDIGPKKVAGMKWYVNLSIMLAYFLLVYILGLVVASLLYLLLAPILMGYKKFKIVAAVAGFWIIVFSYVFYGILQLRMPNGIFEVLFK